MRPFRSCEEDDSQLSHKNNTSSMPSTLSSSEESLHQDEKKVFLFSHIYSSPLLEEDGKTASVELSNVITESHTLREIVKEGELALHFRSAPATLPEIAIYSRLASILHFSGHGDGKNGVVFEYSPHVKDKNHKNIGNAYWLTPQRIKKLKKRNADFKPFLVFVSACNSQAVGEAFRDIVGASHVIAINR
jgi:hypothetical protein